MQRQIRAESKQRGNCQFCGSLDVELVEANSLLESFTPILDLYVIDNSGKDLSSNIISDWGIIGELKENKINKLLIEISGNPLLTEGKYKSRIKRDQGKLKQWQKFSEELKHENRYFPMLGPSPDYLEKYFVFLSLPPEKASTTLYRARINAANIPYAIDEMGKPPQEFVSNGRANPIGISYLYAASDIKTAISEVRPSIGDIVTIVEFEVMQTLPLVDLRDPKNTISPFESVDDLDDIYRDMPFLKLLGDELSKPIVPRAADLEYLPSQYLCEFVKHIGFEGIVYRSSLAEGDNYAIFEENKLTRKNTSNHRVEKIDISYSDA